MTEQIVELLTINQLRNYPVPEWLITGFIHKGDVAVIYGEPGSGKSFLAIDWALSIATGLSWLGHDVAQGPVLYMAGEGAPSIYKRVNAWMSDHDAHHIPGAFFNLHPLPLREDEIIEEIKNTLKAYEDERAAYTGPSFYHDDDGEAHLAAPGLHPALIVVDTLSQFFSGGEENGPEMTQFVNNMRRLAQELNVAILIVHHSNAANLRERGHSSLRGNVEVMFRVDAIEDKGQIAGILLKNDKQKDDPRVKPMKLSLTCLKGSMVISLANPNLVLFDHLELTDKSLMILLSTIETLESKKTESSSHADVIEELDLHKPTFHRRLDKLKQLKLVTGAGRGRSALTLRGRNTLSHG